MLKLERRSASEFLNVQHQAALRKRSVSAAKLAGDASRSAIEKSKLIRYQWDNFRAGKTSEGTFDELWKELLSMAFEKCSFCETPGPNTVEHLEELSRAPGKAFEWTNLLSACGMCNLHRENSEIDARPLDPSDSIDPLEYLGWDDYDGSFTPKPGYETRVDQHVTMYGLHRLNSARNEKLKAVRALLGSLIIEEPPRVDTVDALRAALASESMYLGPVREYLLQPPSEEEARVIAAALDRLPEIRDWVKPWLRPPAWAHAMWR